MKIVYAYSNIAIEFSWVLHEQCLQPQNALTKNKKTKNNQQQNQTKKKNTKKQTQNQNNKQTKSQASLRMAESGDKSCLFSGWSRQGSHTDSALGKKLRKLS